MDCVQVLDEACVLACDGQREFGFVLFWSSRAPIAAPNRIMVYMPSDDTPYPVAGTAAVRAKLRGPGYGPGPRSTVAQEAVRAVSSTTKLVCAPESSVPVNFRVTVCPA